MKNGKKSSIFMTFYIFHFKFLIMFRETYFLFTK